MDTKEWHPQDWLIVIEALVTWAGSDPPCESREERAWVLAQAIAEEQGLDLVDYVFQIDSDYSGNGPTRRHIR